MSRQPFLTTAARALAAAAALQAFAQGAPAAPSIGASPAIPGYGDAVTMELGAMPPVFLPATRYTRSGSTITIDYEYLPASFGPFDPQFGYQRLSLGELPPGNYTVQARLVDIDHPNDAPQTATTNVAVVPPADWGVYVVPQQPRSNEPVNMLVRSAAYFDPATLKASVSGDQIRVDFEYRASAPTGGPAPSGLTSFASVSVGRLPAGNYHVEAWARPDTGGDSQRYFVRDFPVSPQSTVVEFYQEGLDHYFMSAGAAEIDLLDGGGQGGWKRTGQSFHAWSRAEDAPSNAHPVCRFYAAGPNSHFYTGDESECAYLKALEQSGRADAAARGAPFLGWAYEGIAFWALVPTDGQCPSGSDPVWRAYNNRAAENDSNHRFTADPQQHVAMALGWIDEGVAFCSPR